MTFGDQMYVVGEVRRCVTKDEKTKHASLYSRRVSELAASATADWAPGLPPAKSGPGHTDTSTDNKGRLKLAAREQNKLDDRYGRSEGGLQERRSNLRSLKCHTAEWRHEWLISTRNISNGLFLT